MAGRALTPATRHSLGKPLPYQQADGGKAAPKPKNFHPEVYRVLSHFSVGYPRVLGTFLACTHPSATQLNAFDLHVLGTPPAFILSQDQTLHKENDLVHLETVTLTIVTMV